MTELKITPEAVRSAAAKCKQAEAVLKELFPEVFEKDNSVDCSSSNLILNTIKTSVDISERDQPYNYLLTTAIANAPIGLERKCFVLSRDYNWEMKTHNHKSILIPTRK